MKLKNIVKRTTLSIIFLILLVTLIILGRGYRINVEKNSLSPTAILVAKSTPDGAKVIVNGQLKGATDSNIFLTPGKYTIKISKDGFTSWEKTLLIKGEWVININANLFPQNPSLSPITTLGVAKAVSSPTGSKIILLTHNENSEKNGIYQLDNNRLPISIINPVKLIAPEVLFGANYSPTQAQITFSPDEKQMLITFNSASSLAGSAYLIDTDTLATSALDVSQSTTVIIDAWNQQKIENVNKVLETYKKAFSKVAIDNFEVVAFSPDEKKILYTVKKTMTLPIIITPRLIATNQTEEVRNLIPGELYVYDKTEDKNFIVSSASDKESYKTNPFSWYIDSGHLVVRQENDIAVVDYDGTNKRTVYAGPFERDFLSVSTDGRLYILANLNSKNNPFPDVYAIGIR